MNKTTIKVFIWCLVAGYSWCLKTAPISSNEDQIGSQGNLVNDETSSNALVKLNIGGREFHTTMATLTRLENSYFTSLFSKPWEMKMDDKGSIFIDRNGDLFGHILQYLITAEVSLPLLEAHRQRLKIDEGEFYHILMLEVQFYQIESMVDILMNNFGNKFLGGTLLGIREQFKLNEFYGVKNQHWQLLYKASRHGFSAKAFHQLCDDKGATMTIIKSSKGWLFGGFTTQSWSGHEVWKNDPKAFIFTLTNPHKIAPIKFMIQNDQVQNATFAYEGSGASFGGGHDIYVSDNSNTNSGSYTYFPWSYPDTSGKGDNIFTGSWRFTSSDIEVYIII